MTLHISAYCLYLALSVLFTVWVARTLFRNGHVFLYHIFNNDYALADSVNHLLVVGFYLVNLGFISLALKTNEPISSCQLLLEVLSSKMGGVLLTLGLMHFSNMAVFALIQRSTGEHRRKLAGAELRELTEDNIPAGSFVERYSRPED